MFGKRTFSRLAAALGLTAVSLFALSAPAAADGTISTADCLANGGEIKDHNSWVGCHGKGFGSSGTKILD